MQKLFDHPFLGRGFRPFFLLGALYAIVTIGVWIAYYHGTSIAKGPFDNPVIWHGHEMIFGYTVAIIAGFLLTAVANWTAGAPARQIHLAGLVLVWLAGRVAMLSAWPPVIAAVIDLAFLPALAASLAIPLLRSWNKRNFIFLGMLTLLFLCNLATHAGWGLAARTPLDLAVIVIAAMIALVGGRIIPAFTVAALRRRGIEARNIDQPRADMTALVCIALVAVTLLAAGLDSVYTGAACALASATLFFRYRYYHTLRILDDPLVWILHAGYFWVCFGFLALAVAPYSTALTQSLALHVLTIGGIGSMTLGMIVRVALGHTGRELRAGPVATTAFVLMQFAALVRLAPIVVAGMPYLTGVALAGTCWATAFALYIARFTYILFTPRPDGRPA